MLNWLTQCTYKSDVFKATCKALKNAVYLMITNYHLMKFSICSSWLNSWNLLWFLTFKLLYFVYSLRKIAVPPIFDVYSITAWTWTTKPLKILWVGVQRNWIWSLCRSTYSRGHSALSLTLLWLHLNAWKTCPVLWQSYPDFCPGRPIELSPPLSSTMASLEPPDPKTKQSAVFVLQRHTPLRLIRLC